MKKILLFIWGKADGKKSVIFNSTAAYLQYMVAEDIFNDTPFMKWAIKTLLFAGALSLGHKGQKALKKRKLNSTK